MKNILIFLLVLLLQGCVKPKTVLICGDHVCINKEEANQYFEENLSIEVKILDSKQKKKIDLVELNLNSSPDEKKRITLFKKNKTNNTIKELSNEEIKNKKKKIKQRKKEAKKANKNKINQKKRKDKVFKEEKVQKDILLINKPVSKTNEEVVDICTILKKCNIEEISSYLLKKGKEKNFPDITLRE